MGIFDKIRSVFSKKSDKKAIQIDSKSSIIDSNQDNNRSDSIDIDINSTMDERKEPLFAVKENQKGSYSSTIETPSQLNEYPHSTQPRKIRLPEQDSINVQKESLQLGVAAGYTGKAIKEIEFSLGRIERQMPSREWFDSNYGFQLKRTIDMLIDIRNSIEKHNSTALGRFDTIELALNRLLSTAAQAPEPIRSQITQEVESIMTSLPLTPKMRRLVYYVKEGGRISYTDLAANLGISISALRGLLSNTIKRTDEIERFTVNGKGWVRYKFPKTSQIETF